MRIALVQSNPTIGAVEENATMILDGILRAKAMGAELAVFPELTLPGYPPNDLLECVSFVEALDAAERRIVADMPDEMIAIFGNVGHRTILPGEVAGRALENVAVVARRGTIVTRAAKSLLPVYDVFDEARYFEPNRDLSRNLFDCADTRIGISICEDLWNDEKLWSSEKLRDGGAWLGRLGGKEPGRGRLYLVDPVHELVRKGARLLINLSASPWSSGKQALRRRIVAHAARRHGIWVLYTNLVGGNDSLIFDGSSMAYAPGGAHVGSARSWSEDILLVDTGNPTTITLDVTGTSTSTGSDPQSRSLGIPTDEDASSLESALVLGIRDYFRKCRFKKAVIGLSGGIDSAVTAYLAVHALGSDNVIGISMPSPYSSEGSVEDARRLAATLRIEWKLIPIHDVFASYLATLAPLFFDQPRDVTEENLQSRIRGGLLMAFSNKFGAIVLTTGNKSESAMGYCTLYGDTVGGLAVLADLYKHQVYTIASHANRDGEVIPLSSITKAPSAELRPGQKDEDSLPPYPILDRVLELLIEGRARIEHIAESVGVDVELVRTIVRKVNANEFKRKQFPPTLRVSEKAWVGRVYPIAQRFEE